MAIKGLKKTLKAFVDDSKGKKVKGITTETLKVGTITIEVRVTGYAIVKARLKAAIVLIWLAEKVGGFKIELFSTQSNRQGRA